MNRSKQLLAISCCALILSGCASKKDFISLPEVVQNKIESTDVYLEQCSKEMQADVESSNLTTYTGGGLLFALVDSAIVAHRADKANDAMTDIQKELQSFNVHEKFTEKLIQSLQNTNWLHVRGINCTNDLNDEILEEIIKKEKSDSVLTVRFNYKLNPKMTTLTGTVYLNLYPSSPKIQKIVNAEDALKTPLFKFHVSATEVLPHVGENIQDNAKIWTQNKGELLRKGLENILHQVSVNLDRVLKAPNHLPEDN